LKNYLRCRCFVKTGWNASPVKMLIYNT